VDCIFNCSLPQKREFYTRDIERYQQVAGLINITSYKVKIKEIKLSKKIAKLINFKNII
jgi:hypothetical protein